MVGTRRKGRKVWVLGGVSTKELCWFFRQLSILVDAGIPVFESLRDLEEDTPPGALKNVLIDVVDDVENGKSLCEAFRKHPATFEASSVAMIRAGEESGKIELTLRKLADQLEGSRSIRRRVRGAMVYPAVVLTVACGIVAFIMVAIVPKFESIFNDLGISLPQMTRRLIEVSGWFGRYWFALPAFPLAAWMLLKVIRSTASGRYTTDRVLLWIPILGPLVSKAEIARSSQLFGTLVGTSVSTLDAILYVRDACRNAVYQRAFHQIWAAVRDGSEVWEAMEATKSLPKLLIRMTKVGEQSGSLDTTLNKIAEVYSEELDEAVKALMSILEPLMTVLLGILVGVIVISLFLPLVKLIGGMAK